jgi:hypothetical protein
MNETAVELSRLEAAGKGVPAKKRTGRLGTQMRGKLQQDYLARGKSRYSLWYVYSAKARADVVLHGDSQYYHFLLVESDPLVTSASFDVQRHARRIVGEELGQLVDAEIRLADSQLVWRCVRSEITDAVAVKAENLQKLIAHRLHAELPSRLEVVSGEEITAQPMRLQNWNRLIPYLAQARGWPLHVFGNEVATLLHTCQEVALSDVTALAEPGQEALYIAALLRGVQFGRFRSNLVETPWGLGSRFWRAGQ